MEAMRWWSFSISLGLFGAIWLPNATAESLTSAPADSFCIVVIPDTQAYRGQGTKGNPNSSEPVSNPIFATHMRWIAANIERHNIVFVSHVGDIVDINESRQWKVARECMDLIHGKVPYGISVGNHDMTDDGNSSLYQEFFPKARYASYDWYGDCYSGSSMGSSFSGNNANSYQFFSAAGIPFLFMHLECNAPDDVLQWANDVLTKHADRRVLITSHMGWGPRLKPKQDEEFYKGEKGRMEWIKIHGHRGNSAQQIWDKCYRKHPNLIAVFSGDQSRTQAYRAATPGEHGNVIHEFLQDYGSGWLRMYRFIPSENRVDAITFDPKTEELCQGTKIVPDRNEHQFQFEYRLHTTK